MQPKPQTTAPPQKAVVRAPTVRPKPKGKAAKDIPTDPNMAYRAIEHNIDNLYTWKNVIAVAEQELALAYK